MERPFPAYKGDEPYIFVSYAHADEGIVYPELVWLHDQGFNVWYDEGITPGSEWTDALAERITNASVVLFLVTPRSVESDHCQREAKYAVNNQVPLIQVHLERVNLPPGLDLTLSNIQAIIRGDYSEHDYRRKLIQSISAFVVDSSVMEPQQSGGRYGPGIPLRFAVIALVVVLAAAGAIGWYQSDGPNDQVDVSRTGADAMETAEEKDEGHGRSITIQAFQPIGDDVSVQEFAFAISQELDANFVSYPEIKVRDDELAVSYLLKGTLQQIGDTLRVVPRLQRVSDSETIWSDVLDVDPTSPGDTAKGIGRVARMQMVNDYQVEEVRKRYRNVEAIEAYRAALLENHKVNQGGPVDSVFQLNAAKRAVELESIVDAYWLLASGYFDTGRTQEGYEVLMGALAEHPGEPLLLLIDGGIAVGLEIDLRRARSSLRQALDENPLHPQVRWFQAALGMVSVAEGDLQSARRHYENAIRNYDADGRLWQEYAAVLYESHLSQRALDAANRSLSLHEAGGQADLAAGTAIMSLVDLGRVGEAGPYLNRLLASTNRWANSAVWPHKFLKDEARALELLVEKDNVPANEREHATDAVDYCAMDLIDQCVDSLIIAIEHRIHWAIVWARTSRLFEKARESDRWSEVTDLFERERGVVRALGGGPPLLVPSSYQGEEETP